MRLVPQPNAEPDGFPVGSPYTSGNKTSLATQVADIFRRPGIEAHAFIPGIGILSGLPLINAIMEDGTQAASVDNPVGYVGDAASTTLGAELLRYVSVGSNWTDNADGSFTKTVASWGGVGGYGAISPVGKTYRISWRVVSISAGSTLSVYRRNLANTAAEAVGSPITVVAGGTYSSEVTCVSSYATSNVWIDSNTFVGIIDNISVRELVGANPARQATTANKPILRRGHVNRIRNSTMQGAVVGSPGTLPTNWNVNTPGGLTTSVMGTGTEDGLPYIDLRFQGTSSGAAYNLHFDSTTTGGGATVAGVPWDASCYVKLVGGSLANISGVAVAPRYGLANGNIVSSVTAPSTMPDSTLRRIDISTPAAATTERVTARFNIIITSGAAIDVTLRIAAPQLEQGSVANTFVPTTTAAASSPTGPYWMEFDGTDFVTLAAVPFQVQDDAVIVLGARANGSTSQKFFSIRSSATPAAGNLTVTYEGSNTRWISSINDGVTSIFLVFPIGSTPQGTDRVLSFRKIGNTRTLRMNGGLLSSTNTSALSPTTITNAAVGVDASAGFDFVMGAIYPVIVVKGTVTDAELATLERWVGQLSGVQL